MEQMIVRWNSEPVLEEVIVDVRKGTQGEVYLGNDQGFEFTLSPQVVQAIKSL